MPTYTNKHGREFTGTVLHLGGHDVLVALEPRSPHGGRSYRAKARVYGADNLVPEFTALEPRFVAYTDRDSSPEDVADEKAWLAWRRRTVTAATKRLNGLIADGVLGLIVGGDVGRAKFSYNAGCSTCKCSPGYVTDSYVIDPATGRFADVLITPLKGLTRKAA